MTCGGLILVCLASGSGIGLCVRGKGATNPYLSTLTAKNLDHSCLFFAHDVPLLSFKPDIFQWTNITSFGNQPPPPSLWFTAAFHPNVTGSSATNNLTTSNYTIGNYTTRSNSTSNNVAGTSPKLFIFGGCIVGADGQNEVSRQLYVYDISTYINSLGNPNHLQFYDWVLRRLPARSPLTEIAS